MTNFVISTTTYNLTGQRHPQGENVHLFSSRDKEDFDIKVEQVKELGIFPFLAVKTTEFMITEAQDEKKKKFRTAMAEVRAPRGTWADQFTKILRRKS